MTPPRALATVTDYAGLVAAIKARVGELEISYETADELAGLTERHFSKLLAPIPTRGFGPSTMGKVLAALGLVLIVSEDAERMCRIQPRLSEMPKKAKHASVTMRPAKKRKKKGYWRGNTAWSEVMNARRHLILSEAERRASARNAARIRWRKHRAATRSSPKPAGRTPESRCEGSSV